ncbi:ImmA/IrrE family metallo-endopeptidase [Microbacterium sp. CFBP9034]|uniref:ImmA/IrrE family metallo-endopeptidase n=1 Tax=Microbacterium sp. CFBP9034 TaxID=3096540 RepID=UPI002A6AB5C6|nr:ImmA/IrrE family metallo-endopeptidase [Microbacterium sp. CFBP9034]MDY0910110.1 ImmA/IrrE family metallo-endopeptidase [Microbacterium sp. CFBP9034]
MNIEATVSTAMDGLRLGGAFSLDDLVDAIQHRRQRPLRIVELADLNDQDGICALWLETETEDLVLHAHSESALHRQQFVLHELAHMILDHGDDQTVPTPDFLLPDIPASTRRRLLGRQDLDTAHEILAEALADHLAAAIRGSAFHESRFLEIFG